MEGIGGQRRAAFRMPSIDGLECAKPEHRRPHPAVLGKGWIIPPLRHTAHESYSLALRQAGYIGRPRRQNAPGLLLKLPKSAARDASVTNYDRHGDCSITCMMNTNQSPMAPMPEVGRFYRDLDLAWRAWLRSRNDPAFLDVLAAHAGRLRALADEAGVDRLKECVNALLDQLHEIEIQGKRPTAAQLRTIGGFNSDILALLQSSATVAIQPRASAGNLGKPHERS